MPSRSIVPDDRYPAKRFAINCDMTQRWEWQVGGNQQTAGLRQFLEKAHADASSLLGVVLETVLPVGMVESDRKHGVAGESQPFTP